MPNNLRAKHYIRERIIGLRARRWLARLSKEPNNDNNFFQRIGDDLRLPRKGPFRSWEPTQRIQFRSERAVAAKCQDCVRQQLVSRRSDPSRATPRQLVSLAQDRFYQDSFYEVAA
jgi:hypothetical protein